MYRAVVILEIKQNYQIKGKDLRKGRDLGLS